MNLLVRVETTSHHEYHWIEVSEKRIDPAAVDFSPASPKGARAMSKKTMEPTQRTNESVDEAADEPQIGDLIKVAMIVCILALAVASCVELEEAERLLQASSR